MVTSSLLWFKATVCSFSLFSHIIVLLWSIANDGRYFCLVLSTSILKRVCFHHNSYMIHIPCLHRRFHDLNVFVCLWNKILLWLVVTFAPFLWKRLWQVRLACRFDWSCGKISQHLKILTRSLKLLCPNCGRIEGMQINCKARNQIPLPVSTVLNTSKGPRCKITSQKWE